MSLLRRVAPANDGDLGESRVRGVWPGRPLWVYDIGTHMNPKCASLPIQLAEGNFTEHNPSYACRWDNDKIIGALNLTEPETCEE